jgi:UDP-N-acetyl-D-glucosamine dehydrogenase
MLQTEENQTSAARLASAIAGRTAVAGVIGLGYVGLPLATAIARAGFHTFGFDIDPGKIVLLEAGKSYIHAVKDAQIGDLVRAKRFAATPDFAALSGCDIIVICVPTPLTRHRDPDLSYVTKTAQSITERLRPGQLVVLESTTFPGTTTEIVRPILEQSGLQCGVDFFLGFSPEREDPGNATYQTASIPKIVAGDGADAQYLIEAFYKAVVETVVPVS